MLAKLTQAKLISTNQPRISFPRSMISTVLSISRTSLIHEAWQAPRQGKDHQKHHNICDCEPHCLQSNSLRCLSAMPKVQLLKMSIIQFSLSKNNTAEIKLGVQARSDGTGRQANRVQAGKQRSILKIYISDHHRRNLPSLPRDRVRTIRSNHHTLDSNPDSHQATNSLDRLSQCQPKLLKIGVTRNITANLSYKLG